VFLFLDLEPSFAHLGVAHEFKQDSKNYPRDLVDRTGGIPLHGNGVRWQ
jgi:hypothetical protein